MERGINPTDNFQSGTESAVGSQPGPLTVKSALPVCSCALIDGRILAEIWIWQAEGVSSNCIFTGLWASHHGHVVARRLRISFNMRPPRASSPWRLASNPSKSQFEDTPQCARRFLINERLCYGRSNGPAVRSLPALPDGVWSCFSKSGDFKLVAFKVALKNLVSDDSWAIAWFSSEEFCSPCSRLEPLRRPL
ncbi:MAG: hypothetical protein JWM99_2445 [Verrucomicrobiales bacterium]|nr:hypothetical protein [Verrucomicrobiales bacterium]